jgi:acetyltransferase-like isoleucine patch superfamily enzyme
MNAPLMSGSREFQSGEFIRAKLHSSDKSSFRRYKELVVGSGSTWDWIRYELITAVLGCLPGAVGLLLRKIFYPMLFRKCGINVIFGRSLVIRNPQNIELSDGVFIDDFCLLDGRGGSEEPLMIGDRVILNRGVTVQAKIGTIRIGADSDIGAGCSIISQGGVFLGKEVSLGGNCDVGGGLFATEKADPAMESAGCSSEADFPKHRKFTKGPVRVGDRTVTGMDVVILDGVEIGADCIIGGGAVVRESVPGETVVSPHQRLVFLRRHADDRPAVAAT